MTRSLGSSGTAPTLVLPPRALPLAGVAYTLTLAVTATDGRTTTASVALLAADNDPPQVSVDAHYSSGADRFNQGAQVRLRGGAATYLFPSDTDPAPPPASGWRYRWAMELRLPGKG